MLLSSFIPDLDRKDIIFFSSDVIFEENNAIFLFFESYLLQIVGVLRDEVKNWD
jgi:hypothetical protein